MRVDLIESYGTDLTPVNAARVSFANESNFIGAADADIAAQIIASRGNRNDVDALYLAYTDEIPQNAGNTGGYLSRADYGLIHYLAKHKHTSCFEHQGATCRLKVPIFIARQIQRHRTFAYNEVSRRYVDTPPEFFVPDSWRKRADNVKQGSSEETVDNDVWTISAWGLTGTNAKTEYDTMVKQAVAVYENMLSFGVAPEMARMILPQSMYTEFYMSGNLRNWAHFLKLRLDGHAQLEVQQVAQQVADLLTPVWPVSMEALMAYD